MCDCSYCKGTCPCPGCTGMTGWGGNGCCGGCRKPSSQVEEVAPAKESSAQEADENK